MSSISSSTDGRSPVLASDTSGSQNGSHDETQPSSNDKIQTNGSIKEHTELENRDKGIKDIDSSMSQLSIDGESYNNTVFTNTRELVPQYGYSYDANYDQSNLQEDEKTGGPVPMPLGLLPYQNMYIPDQSYPNLLSLQSRRAFIITISNVSIMGN